MMIDRKDFAKIRDELKKFEEKREALIQSSRKVITLSKHIIYALHREDMNKAESLSKKIRSDAKKLPPEDCGTGMKHVALQEYVEAMALLGFVKSKKVPSRKSLNVPTEAYLGGLADLTGELVRMAVNRAIKKKDKDVLVIKGLVEDIYGEFLQLDLRNSELRKKSDQIKWNLQKLEDIAYDISKKSAAKR